jgi:hypothetical protein
VVRFILALIIVVVAGCQRAECVSDSDCNGTDICRDALCIPDERAVDDTRCSTNTRELTVEYYGFVDLVTDRIFPEDFTGASPLEPWDIAFAYNAGTEPNPAFVQVNFERNVGWARVDAPFANVCEPIPESFATNPDFTDAPLSPTTSFVIRTHAGTRVKIGAPGQQFQEDGGLLVRFSRADFD